MCIALKRELRSSSLDGTDSLLDSMQKKSYRLLEYLNISLDHEIPIVEIIKKFGIKVFKDASMDKDLSAYIVIDPNIEEKFGANKIVCVNDNDSLGHKRFALAHELAHYIFDYNESEEVKYYNTYLLNDKRKNMSEEIRANKFAASLLMPENEFRKAESEYSRGEDKASTVSRLAKRFSVSTKAVFKRFDELGIAGYERYGT